MFVVDTNVLIHAADADSPAHSACARLLESSRVGNSAWYCTWGILYEFLRVSTHSRVLHAPLETEQAWEFVKAVIASRSLEILVETERHPAVFEEVASGVPLLRGNLMHDAHTAVLMREHGISRICTRDTDFHRFSFLEVIDPLTA